MNQEVMADLMMIAVGICGFVMVVPGTQNYKLRTIFGAFTYALLSMDVIVAVGGAVFLLRDLT